MKYLQENINPQPDKYSDMCSKYLTHQRHKMEFGTNRKLHNLLGIFLKLKTNISYSLHKTWRGKSEGQEQKCRSAQNKQKCN